MRPTHSTAEKQNHPTTIPRFDRAFIIHRFVRMLWTVGIRAPPILSLKSRPGIMQERRVRSQINQYKTKQQAFGTKMEMLIGTGTKAIIVNDNKLVKIWSQLVIKFLDICRWYNRNYLSNHLKLSRKMYQNKWCLNAILIKRNEIEISCKIIFELFSLWFNDNT